MKEEDINKHIDAFFEEENRQIEIPAGMENRMERLIDELDKTRLRKSLWMKIGGIAAGFALLISSGIYFLQNEENKSHHAILSPEEAYAETQRALMLVAQNLNRGFEQIDKMNEELDKTNLIINKILR